MIWSDKAVIFRESTYSIVLISSEASATVHVPAT
jgi:hypothetical protein